MASEQSLSWPHPVDLADHLRHGVDRVQALVRVHVTGGVGVARHLPAAAIDRLEARAHLQPDAGAGL